MNSNSKANFKLAPVDVSKCLLNHTVLLSVLYTSNFKKYGVASKNQQNTAELDVFCVVLFVLCSNDAVSPLTLK